MVNYEVPFFSNTEDDTHCFQASLRMVLKYFLPEREFSWKELEKLTAKPNGKWTWPMASMLWLIKNDFEIKDIETFDYDQFARDGEKYLLETYGREVTTAQVENSDIEQERRLSAELVRTFPYTRSVPTQEDLKSLLDEGFLLICNINANALNTKEGYSAHAVVLKGYTNDSFILHDPGLPPHKDRKVPFNLFEKSWAYPEGSAKNVLAVRLK